MSDLEWYILTSNRNSTVGDVARKVMGDVPIAYVEGAGGVRVSEDEIVEVGKHDVGTLYLFIPMSTWLTRLTIVGTVFQSRSIVPGRCFII